MRRRGEAVKILEVGSLALFGLLTAYTWLGAPTWTVATVRLAVDAGLLAIVLVSLAIGQPFTLQYARERVPEQFWALPVFFTTNVVITTIWAGASRCSWPPTPRPNGCPRCRSGSTSSRRSWPSWARCGSATGIRPWSSAGVSPPPSSASGVIDDGEGKRS